MADFLSEAAPVVDETVSTVVQQLVTGGPDGNAAFCTTYENGRVVTSTPVAAPAKGDAVPPVTLALAYDDARRVAAGDLELGAAFMQGRLKAEGDMKTILALLLAAHSS